MLSLLFIHLQQALRVIGFLLISFDSLIIEKGYNTKLQPLGLEHKKMLCEKDVIALTSNMMHAAGYSFPAETIIMKFSIQVDRSTYGSCIQKKKYWLRDTKKKKNLLTVFGHVVHRITQIQSNQSIKQL